MKDKNLEKILIVEDRPENRKAAQEYFSAVDNVELDMASTYDEAKEKLEDSKDPKYYFTDKFIKSVYNGAILDIEIPRKEGEEPENLGLELGKEMDIVKGKYRIPHVFLSGRHYENHTDQVRVFVDEHCAENFAGERVGENKRDIEAWKGAYKTLRDICGNR